MIKIIFIIFTIVLCISFVFSDNNSGSIGSSDSSSSSSIDLINVSPIIRHVQLPISDKYGTGPNQCDLNIGILLEYHTPLQTQMIAVTSDNAGFQSTIKNDTHMFIQIRQRIPIGKNQPLSFQGRIDATSPGIQYAFNNYAYADCEPLPNNLTMKSKQDKWQLVYDPSKNIVWIKAFEVNGLGNLSAQSGAFVCSVPQQFYCSVTQFFNGPQIRNFLVQIIALTSSTPYAPFNVVISDYYGRVLHTSPFDGLQSPTNPPPIVTSLQMYPPSGSTVIKKEMVNNAMYLVNILNKNTIFNVATDEPSLSYFQNSGFFPVLGNQANGQYIAFNPVFGIDSSYQHSFTSNIQLIDSQGVKRIGGNNIFYVVDKQYDSYTTNSVGSVSYNPIINSTLLNAKIDAVYNPEIHISCDSMNYFNDASDSAKGYPWSYSNGTVQFHTLSATCIDSPYFISESIEISIATTNYNYIRFPNPDYFANSDNYTHDRTPPIVKKVELVGALFEKVILRIHATDNLSGVSFISVGNNKATLADLVYGDQFDGIYEYVIDFYSYYLGSLPDFTVYDNAGFGQSANLFTPIYNLEFDSIPEYPSYKYVKDNNIDPFSFSSFEFKYNDVDVSNGPFNNTLCFNINGADKNMIPRFLPFFHSLNPERFQPQDAIEGSYDYVKNMFCVNFQIPARMFTGELDYLLLFTPNIYSNYYLASTIGNAAQLRVKSSYADQMPPVITEFTAYPSNNVAITQNMNVGWDIRIEDSPNGMVSAEFNITSDYDLEPYTIRVTPSNAISGNSNNGVYQLRIPITASTCRSQSFRISSASISDSQGHTSKIPSSFNVNPLFKFLNSAQLTLNITCPQAIVDNVPPVLTSFTSSHNTIDVGTHSGLREITFTFTTSDSGSGISSRHNPYVYFRSQTFATIKQVSKQLSNSNGVATYTATVQLPYGYGAYQDILISLYGIVDNQLNINGYSTLDLESIGFQSTIKVTYSNTPVLDSTSAINSTGTRLTIYGHKFGIDQSKLTLQIDYNKGQGWINTPVSFFSGIILMTQSIQPISTPFYVRVIVNGQTSNSILVTPTIFNGQCGSYEVIQSVVSTWINSEIYPFALISITIKNTGNKAIKLFNFVMDDVDQIWGVSINGNRYTLPSYNEIINPNDQYSFGYIIKGTTAGQLKDIQYSCL